MLRQTRNSFLLSGELHCDTLRLANCWITQFAIGAVFLLVACSHTDTERKTETHLPNSITPFNSIAIEHSSSLPTAKMQTNLIVETKESE